MLTNLTIDSPYQRDQTINVSIRGHSAAIGPLNFYYKSISTDDKTVAKISANPLQYYYAADGNLDKISKIEGDLLLGTL